MSFPKISRKVVTAGNTRFLEIETKFLTKKLTLRLDKKVCTGCGVCYNVCPKEAIDRGPIGAAKRLEIAGTPDLDLSPEVADPNKCSYCGVCVTMCPFNALSLLIDGEEVAIPNLQINKEHALPELEIEEAITKKSKQKVKKYFEGEIKLDSTKCAGGCSTCVLVCPTGAISKPPPTGKGGWVMSEKTILDERDCVYCGACYSVCGSDAIKFKRTKIYLKKGTAFNEPFWPTIEKKLLTPKRSLTE